ncbi:MAG: hypothetical protein ACPGPS_20555 [Rubripirellula sp.]
MANDHDLGSPTKSHFTVATFLPISHLGSRVEVIDFGAMGVSWVVHAPVTRNTVVPPLVSALLEGGRNAIQVTSTRRQTSRF